MINLKSIKPIVQFGGGLSLLILLSACGSSTDTNTPEDSTAGSGIVNNNEVETDNGANTSEGTGGLDLDSDSSNDGDTGAGGADTNSEVDAGTGTGASDTGAEGGTGTGGSDAGSDTDGGGTNTNGTTDEHLIFGSVSIDAYQNETYLNAVFVDFNQPIPQAIIESDLELPLTQDICEAESDDGSIVFGERTELNLDENIIEYLSAGEVLTITGPNGTYAELQRTSSDFEGVVLYTLPDNAEINGKLPDGLTITIPGDEYPGFSDVAIPNAVPLQLTSNNNRNDFSRDTTLTWVADANPMSKIYFSAYLDDLYISCYLVDDGEFTLPEGLKVLINTDQQSFFDVGRETNNFIRQGNTVLSVFTYSSLLNE